MNLLTVLILNLVIIFITMVAFHFLIVEKFPRHYAKYKPIHLTLIATIQIVLCMFFTYRTSENFIFDLRIIPVILGGLYGGPIVSFSLFSIVMMIRFPLGGDGVWITFFNMLTATGFISWISTKFMSFPLFRKQWTVIAISFSYTFLIFLMKAVTFREPTDFSFILIYFITVSTGIVVLIYYIELIRQNFFLHKAMINSEKIEVVSQLAASVSHEVRNPLTVTRGFLQMLKDPSVEEDKRVFYLNTAIEELDRAENIIKDYLSFARPHNETQSRLSLEDEIDKVLELILPYANHFSVTINKQLTPGLFVSGDASKFQQCILNIVKNGIEAMPNGGNLFITSRPNKNGDAAIEIFDNGCGMTETQITKLGEPYYSTKAERGTGLGMMVVFRIIQEMGGSIQVKSKLAEGSHFTITLPIVK